MAEAIKRVVRGEGIEALYEMLQKPRVEKEVREVLLSGPAGTGKSTATLLWIWWVFCTFPKARILLCRKTRVSLTESALKTFEDNVVPPNHPVLEGATRAHRQSYIHPKTKAEIVVGGMDNPTRLYSTDWDVIYVQEATELDEDEWERLRRGLRNWKLPVMVLVGDCNPDAPTHWLYRRTLDKKTELYPSYHYDNPAWFDADANTWTPEGIAYLNSLRSLTGVRKRRLFDGEWVSSEGAVWENFDASVHLIEVKDPWIELGIRWTMGSMDWGFTAAGVLQIFGVDSENRAYLLREHYMTEKPLEWWSCRVEEEMREWRLSFVVADPSRPDAILHVNEYLAKKHLPRIVRSANNRRAQQGADLGGIDLVRRKLDKQRDGKPALYFLKGALVTRDDALNQKREVCCTVEEIPSYVYAKVENGKLNKERTDPSCADHGCDSLRYACAAIWNKDYSSSDAGPVFAHSSAYATLGHQETWDEMKYGREFEGDTPSWL